jgi:hypothetical protein
MEPKKIRYNAKKKGWISIKYAAILKETTRNHIIRNFTSFNFRGVLIKYDKKFIEWQPKKPIVVKCISLNNNKLQQKSEPKR